MARVSAGVATGRPAASARATAAVTRSALVGRAVAGEALEAEVEVAALVEGGVGERRCDRRSPPKTETDQARPVPSSSSR